MNEEKYLVAIYSFSYFGPVRTKLLISYFGSPKKVWAADKKGLLEIGLKENVVHKFIEYRQNLDLKRYFDKLRILSVKFITYKDKNYPLNLKGLSDAPLVLYYKGTLKKSDKNAVAIVGSRKNTSYGREVATKLSGALASYGIVIVSGLAFGIDTAAHKSCLEVGGRTLAVLASGLDIITPTTNTFLAKEIIKKDGAIISEYPLGHRPGKSDFPERNRIISGLSKAVLVIEGAQKSGTLHTASHAAEQGRQVFAVPGQITNPMSEAPHYLIKNGARLVTGVLDILNELDLQIRADSKVVEKIIPKGKDEVIILRVLETEPLHLDEIVRISGLTASTVSSRLTIMEIKGIVKNIGNGIYKKI